MEGEPAEERSKPGLPEGSASGKAIKNPRINLGPGGVDGDTDVAEQHAHTRDAPVAGARNPLGSRLGSDRSERNVRAEAMARTTFLRAVRAYLDAMRPYYRPITLDWYRRNLMTTWRDLRALRSAAAKARPRRAFTTTPSMISATEIDALLLRWRTRPGPRGVPMDVSTQEKYLMTLEGFLAWCGNSIVSVMKKSKHVHFPRGVVKPVRVLDEGELARIRTAAEGVDGWPGTVARFIVGFLPATGLRPKEFRLARVQDLEVAKRRILVSHPKGEASWAVPDFAPLTPGALRAVEDYLPDREAFLGGVACDWLVPFRNGEGTLGPWSEAMLRKLKGELSRRSGVAFSLKTFRATFGQVAKDLGVSIEAVSRAMRHSSTETTEAFYARIRADDAFHEIEKAFEAPKLRPR